MDYEIIVYNQLHDSVLEDLGNLKLLTSSFIQFSLMVCDWEERELISFL